MTGFVVDQGEVFEAGEAHRGKLDTSWLRLRSQAATQRAAAVALSAMEKEAPGQLRYMEKLAKDIKSVIYSLEHGHTPDLEPLYKAASFLDPSLDLRIYETDWEDF